MSTKKKLLLSAAGVGGGTTTDVDDVFSTDTWTGNAGSQIIENGIKLSNTHDGGSARFPGTSGLVIPDHAGFQFGTGNWTIEAWVFPTANSDFVVCSWGESSGVRWDFGWQSSSNPRILVNTSSSSQTSQASSTPISGYVGQWVHMACVRNGSDIVLYVGGVAKTTMSYTGTSFPNPSTAGVNIGGRFYTGQNNFNNASTGFISDFRIVKGTAVYTSNFTPSTSYLSSVSGTSFLGLSGDTPLVDQSSNTHSISQNSYNSQGVVASEFGHVTGSDGEGGLVWTKQRSSGSNEHHWLLDTARTAQYTLSTNLDSAQINQTSYAATFNSAGYQLYNWAYQNDNNEDYVGWTFRKAPKFFDIVTWTGNGTENRQISHNLGSVPGMIIVKGYSLTEDWNVYHRSTGNAKYLQLNSTAAEVNVSTGVGGANLWFSTNPTSTYFTVDEHARVNGNGNSYIAYIFAHNNNDGEFGPDADQDIIKCGSYAGTGTSTVSVDLGFEPQWVLIKKATADVSGNQSYQSWAIQDSMRGFTAPPFGSSNGYNNILWANGNVEEGKRGNLSGNANTGVQWHPTATGFDVPPDNKSECNENNMTFIYMAIRRGPMATPTAGTEVFAIDTQVNQDPPKFDSGFVVDFELTRNVASTANWAVGSRLIQGRQLNTENTNAETSNPANAFDFMDGWNGETSSTNSDVYSWMWKRAPGYFDVVCHNTGSSDTQIKHNLGVTPELAIYRNRSGDDWNVISVANGVVKLNSTDAAFGSGNGSYMDKSFGANASATHINGGALTGNNVDLIIYLFATAPGVSKVGSYTGNSTNGKQIDCGFSSGARFVLLKNTTVSSTNWLVFDTVRGIVAGNDARLYLNTTGSQNSGTDYIDPYSSGFALTANAQVNYSGSTYLFYAIA